MTDQHTPKPDASQRANVAALIAIGLCAKTTPTQADDYRVIAESAVRMADALSQALVVPVVAEPTVAERRAAKLAEEEAEHEKEQREKDAKKR